MLSVRSRDKNIRVKSEEMKLKILNFLSIIAIDYKSSQKNLQTLLIMKCTLYNMVWRITKLALIANYEVCNV